MKREIRFRGYSIEQRKWLYGGVLIFADGTAIMPDGETEDDKMITSPVDPNSIGQFTGLKDCNEKEIYEGDIIDIHQTVNGHSLFILESIFPLVIKYTYGDLYEYDMLELLDYARPYIEIEVIGNIHEHPQLLQS